MEPEIKTNGLVIKSKKRKKKISPKNQDNQVIAKVDNQNNKLNMNKKSHLNIDPCMSSNSSIVSENSNSTSNLTEKLKMNYLNYPARHLDKNEFIKIDRKPINMSSDMNLNSKNPSCVYLENCNQQNTLICKNLTQFEACEKNGFVRCCFCHCIIGHEIQSQHATKCQLFIDPKLIYIENFHCLICDITTKSFKYWKSHAVNIGHIGKCMVKNNYVSYTCSGCKTVFYGDKDYILNHCKAIHNNISNLPFIFKCMQEVFEQFIFLNPGNRKTWTFCGPCKIFSSTTISCSSSNHNNNNKHLKYFKCNSCLIYFECKEELYNKHLMSYEHIMLEHLRIANGLKPDFENEFNLKLSSVTIDNDKATSNDGESQMVPSEELLTNRLIECIYKPDINSNMKIRSFFCAVCNEIMLDFHQWKRHVILPSHLIKCHGINDLVSYTCEICSLHCYGNVYHVTDHQCIHPNNSEKNLSKFMAFNFKRINNDIKSKEFYYCGDCETYAEVNFEPDHWNKSHKNKLSRKICKPCRTEFFCIEGNEIFNKHMLSSEHIILKYVSNKTPHLEPLTKSKQLNILKDENKKPCDANDTQEIINKKSPFNIKMYLNWFQNVDEFKSACILCNQVVTISEQAFIHHMLVCKMIYTKIQPKINISDFQCLECPFKSNNYDTWEHHAILHIKLNTYGLYSYFCTTCNSLLYGKLNDIELHLKEHDITISDMPLETVLMAKQLMRRNNNNICKSDIVCLCKPCKKIFNLLENHNHFNTDSHTLVSSDFIELFYCEYCLVEFYSSNMIIECHKLTAEHIILSSEYGKNHDINSASKPLKLDTHLFKFTIDQTLYDKTLNIGFFCFVCDYLCFTLNAWKSHITGRKHNSLNENYMDHRCKICKTLIFGTREHIFNHYKNIFHSMLRKFKLATSTTNNNKKYDLILQTDFKTTATDNILVEESTNNNNEIHSMEKMINEFSLELNIKENHHSQEESTPNIKEACLLKEIVEVLPKSNTQNFSKFFELKFKILEELIQQSQEIKLQIIYYCVPCDFITTIQQNWNHHNITDHSNQIEVRHTIYCEICNLYQIGPCNNLDLHIKSNEHKYMEDFKKKYKTNNNKKVNENNTDKIAEREIHNGRIMIEITTEKLQYKKNNWTELKKILSFYGYFGSYSKQNSLTIIFRKLVSMDHFMKDKEKLEKLHEININIIVEEEKWPELHNTTKIEFGNKDKLQQIISMQVTAINQEISFSDIYHRITLLINAIHFYAGIYFMRSKIYVFGSRMSGLALKESDVDLYYDIADTFSGSLSNDLNAQEDLVRYFGKVFRSQKNEFKQIQQITGARVPIVKFYHCPSRLYCDLSFKSGLSTHNTKLVRLYLLLDKRIHWIVFAVVKHWALQNDLKNQSMFTSYALAWLVLFYLMTVNVVPPLKLLRDNALYSKNASRNEIPDEMFIEDWDCTFCTLEKANQIWKVRDVSCWDLLCGFFSFYSDSNRLKQFVLCPAIGKIILKETFFDIPLQNPDELGFYKKKYGNITQWCDKLRRNFSGEGLAVQDPFDLFHNITKTIVPRKLQNFSHLCNQTLKVMNKGIQPYYA